MVRRSIITALFIALPVRKAAVEIEIADERGEPKRVVEIAKERKKKAEEEARREKDPYLDFDEVWCVFDRDDHERFDAACSMARGNGFELAVSNPCFELWLLLHFPDSRPVRGIGTLSAGCSEYTSPGYDKRLDFNDVSTGVDDATARARRLDEDACSMGEPMRNPTTGFYRLTDSIARKDDIS